MVLKLLSLGGMHSGRGDSHTGCKGNLGSRVLALLHVTLTGSVLMVKNASFQWDSGTSINLQHTRGEPVSTKWLLLQFATCIVNLCLTIHGQRLAGYIGPGVAKESGHD